MHILYLLDISLLRAAGLARVERGQVWSLRLTATSPPGTNPSWASQFRHDSPETVFRLTARVRERGLLSYAPAICFSRALQAYVTKSPQQRRIQRLFAFLSRTCCGNQTSCCITVDFCLQHAALPEDRDLRGRSSLQQNHGEFAVTSSAFIW